MREERQRAWRAIVSQAARYRLTLAALRSMRKAGEVLGLTVEDMEDIEAAIGFRGDFGEVYPRYASVPKYKPPK
jgi:hypothetical protein